MQRLLWDLTKSPIKDAHLSFADADDYSGGAIIIASINENMKFRFKIYFFKSRPGIALQQDFFETNKEHMFFTSIKNYYPNKTNTVDSHYTVWSDVALELDRRIQRALQPHSVNLILDLQKEYLNG